MSAEPQQSVDEQANHAASERGNAAPSKSAVRALLGMPEGEGADVTFPQPPAPVGFRYLPHAWSDEPPTPPGPERETGRATVDVTLTGSRNPSERPTQKREASPDVMPAGSRNTSEHLAQRPAASPDPAAAPGRVVPNVPERPPAPPMPAAGRHQDLLPQRAQPHPTGIVSGVPPAPGAAMIPPTAAAPTVEPERPDKEKESEVRGLAASVFSPRTVYVPVLSPGEAGETTAGGTEPRLPQVPMSDAPRPEVWHVASGMPGPTTPVEAAIPAGKDTPSHPETGRRASTALPGMAAPIHPTAARVEAEPAPGRDTAAEIEQLRRMVRELAAKMAARQAKVPPESPGQQAAERPSPTRPRLIVIKQAEARSRLPHAFWERSHLLRWSLQPWR
jgi:hypothetical protein